MTKQEFGVAVHECYAEKFGEPFPQEWELDLWQVTKLTERDQWPEFLSLCARAESQESFRAALLPRWYIPVQVTPAPAGNWPER